MLNHILTPARWAVTWDLGPISSKPPRSGTRDGRIDRNSTVFQHSLLCPTFSCRQLKAIRRLSSQSFRRRAPGSGNLRPRPHVTCSTTISLFATTNTFRSVRSLASRTLYLRRIFLYCLGIHGALGCSTTVGDHSECNSYHIQIGLLERSPCT